MLAHPFIQKIQHNITHRHHSICIGLDPDPEKLPKHLPQTLSGIEQFLKEIITATKDIAIAYKPNISFFEALGIEGLQLLHTIRSYIPSDVPMIIDGKRGDIGNTSKKQAHFIFDYLGADATTLHPYMGIDSLSPFFDYQDKFNFVLVLTSNPSATDFEKLVANDQRPYYAHILDHCTQWNHTYGNVGCVVGATQSELSTIREMTDDLLFLIPRCRTTRRQLY